MDKDSMKENDKQQQNSRNIRRYYCEYCGIGRSKNYLLRSHILLQHKAELEEVKLNEVGPFKPASQKVLHACEQCGATFWKPAHLKQHMRCHSVERPFACPVEDCYYSYRRKDHLNRHLLKHNGKVFDCPFQSCNRTFVFQGNMRRHVNQCHYDGGDDKDDVDDNDDDGVIYGDVNDDNEDDDVFDVDANDDDDAIDVHANDDDVIDVDANDDDDDVNEEDDVNDDFNLADGDAGGNNISCKDEKQHVCNEPGCGKSFKYACRLKKHEGSHSRVEYLEVFCGEPQCMKPFTNKKCLEAHIQSCHRYVKCEVCGTQQLRNNIKRHRRSHEAPGVSDRIKCTFPGCQQVFANKSNLDKHVRAVHEDLRPYRCGSTGCGKKFPYKHVRDNHEKTHAYQQGDFLEADEEWRSRPRGGKKKRRITAEMLMRKRVVPMGSDNLPSTSIVRDDGAQYLRWLLSDSCS